MKKVMRIFTVAAIAFGMTMAVSCNKDPEENGGNGGNGEEAPETLLEESFNNGIPSTWTTIDADGDGYNWVAGSQAGFQQLYGLNESNCAMSASYTNQVGALTADNYLISPKIKVPSVGGYKLTYYVASFQDNYPDSYAAMVGTLSNGTFTPIKTLVEEQVTNGMIHAVSESQVVDGDGLKQVTLNLDDVKGQEVYIAFRHHCTDCYWIIIDEVKVAK